jgi:carboxypeptidase Taq
MSEYERFEKKAKTITNLGQIGELLTWDQEVMMPEKGIKARSQQKSVLSTLEHQKLTEDKLGELLGQLKGQELDRIQEANVREVGREHEKAVKVPEELAEKISEKSSTCVGQWKKSKKEDDFESFAEELEELVELKRKYANHLDEDEEPYKALFKDYEPYIEFDTMETILERLKTELTEFIEKIRELDTEIGEDVFKGEFPAEKQKNVSRKLIQKMGFPSDRGRFDESEHPFTLGNQFDARITTRYNVEDLSEGLGATVHETGHALYQLGLPQEHYGLPAGSSRDLSVHESQSRLWENHVLKSREFWNHFLPELKEEFPEQFEDVSEKDCYESINEIQDDNLIRIYADEITYHLHIIVRFEVGRALMNGEIEVDELPAVWNERYEKYLGIRPETVSEGIMQDIHWAWGNFGYFPTYTLGSVIAAQIYNTAENEIDNLDQKISEGEFMQLRNWLKEEIHSRGQIYRTEKLIEKATGEKPTADYFLEYIRGKYKAIYGL